MATICKMCGTSNDDGVQFCAACGSAMEGPAGQVRRDAASQQKGVPAKTMMFGVAPQTAQQPGSSNSQGEPPAVSQPVSSAETPAAQPGGYVPKRTVLGVPAVTVSTAQPSPPPAAQIPMVKPIQTPRQPDAPSAQAAFQAKHTVLGMPAMVGDFAKEAEAAYAASKQKQAADPQPPQADLPVAREPEAPQPPPQQPEQTTQPAQPHQQGQAVRAATEPLQPVPKAASQPAPVGPEQIRRPAADDYSDSWPEEDEIEPSKRKKSGKGLLIIALVAGVVVLSGVTLLLYLLLFKGASDLKPAIFPSPDASKITVALSFEKAPPGTTIQVQGQAVAVMNGQAQFELPLTQMQLGTNQVQVIYIEPGKTPENKFFPIILRHSVTTDLSGLVAADPFFVANFQVAPDITLAVDGQPVQLGAGNIYSHRVMLSQVQAVQDPNADNAIHRISFQLTGKDGFTEQGQQVVTIPLTKLQIDRPAADAVVAAEAITCSGSTEEGATVTVNGSPVGVVAGAFNTTVPLMAIGVHNIEVTARAPGKAPRNVLLKVSRIQNMEAAIEEWAKDVDDKLDYPTLARDPIAHVGKKVKFYGRVVNISTQKGVTAFLLYVGSGCPVGAKCAVYVAFRGETDAGLQSMVNVYGSVRGTWDVELQGGRKETMPALDAKFVVKEMESGGKKRRR